MKTHCPIPFFSAHHGGNIVQDSGAPDLEPLDQSIEGNITPLLAGTLLQSPQVSNSHIPLVKCCNDMFPCEDDAEARWMAVHTGKMGIGTNSVDDFYSLFIKAGSSIAA